MISSTSENKRMIIAGCIGNIVEWYNFLLYAYLAVLVSKLFFPEMLAQRALFFSFLLLAVGFISRPLGALIFGILADHWGRQKTLLASQICMAIPTFLICILPVYSQIGIFAPVLLGVMRFLQGVAVGGEQPTALAYLAEMAPIKRRGLWVSVIPSATAGGILLSSAAVYVFMHLLTPEQFADYGWRLCFLTGFLVTVFGVWYRWTLPESEVFLKFTASAKKTNGATLITRHYALQIISMVGLVTTQAFFYQLLYIWTPSFLNTTLHIPLTNALLFNMIIMLLFCACILVGGYLIDIIGRRPLLLGTTLSLAIFSALIYSNIDHLSFLMMLSSLILISIIFGLFMGTISTVFTEIFPAKIRVLSISMAFNIPLAIIGGLTPSFLELATKQVGLIAIAASCIIIGIISFISSFGVDDMTGKSIS